MEAINIIYENTSDHSSEREEKTVMIKKAPNEQEEPPKKSRKRFSFKRKKDNDTEKKEGEGLLNIFAPSVDIMTPNTFERVLKEAGL